jgi:hypothetical protein
MQKALNFASSIFGLLFLSGLISVVGEAGELPVRKPKGEEIESKIVTVANNLGLVEKDDELILRFTEVNSARCHSQLTCSEIKLYAGINLWVKFKKIGSAEAGRKVFSLRDPLLLAKIQPGVQKSIEQVVVIRKEEIDHVMQSEVPTGKEVETLGLEIILGQKKIALHALTGIGIESAYLEKLAQKTGAGLDVKMWDNGEIVKSKNPTFASLRFSLALKTKAGEARAEAQTNVQDMLKQFFKQLPELEMENDGEENSDDNVHEEEPAEEEHDSKILIFPKKGFEHRPGLEDKKKSRLFI